MEQAGEESKTERLYLKYVDNFSDIQRILLSEDIRNRCKHEELPMLPNAVYLGVYLNKKIISLFVYWQDLFHFYVLKKYRAYSALCLNLFEREFKGCEVIFDIPNEFEDAILFAKSQGYTVKNSEPTQVTKWVL